MITRTQGPRGHAGPQLREDGPKAHLKCVIGYLQMLNNPFKPNYPTHDALYRIILLSYSIPFFHHHSLILKGMVEIALGMGGDMSPPDS